MNIIAISGNLTSDIELKQTPEGVSVCKFTVAVRRPNAKDRTDFLNCVAWRAKAEFMARYFRKGQRIEVVGCMTSRKWEDKNKNKRVAFEIACEEVSFGEAKKKDEAGPAEEQTANFEDIPGDEALPF